MRRVVALVLALTIAGAATASAAPVLRLTALRVVTANGRTPVAQPLTRGVAYAYRLDYRVGSRHGVRVTRTGMFLSPYGDILQQIAPPPALADPGRLFASGPIRVPKSESPGDYQLRYSVTVRNSSGSTTRDATLRIRFR